MKKTKWPAHRSPTGTRAVGEQGPPDESSVWGTAPEDRAQGVSPGVLTLVHTGLIWGL